MPKQQADEMIRCSGSRVIAWDGAKLTHTTVTMPGVVQRLTLPPPPGRGPIEDMHPDGPTVVRGGVLWMWSPIEQKWQSGASVWEGA